MTSRPTPRPGRPSARTLVAGALCAGALAAFGSPVQAQLGSPTTTPESEFCLAQPLPIPTGVTDRPADDFGTQPDYFYLHSSTNLQGYPALEKFAAGLFYFPSTPTELKGFQSVIVVTNPTPAPGAAAAIAIDYYDEGGNFLATTVATIPAEGTHTEVASALALGSVPGPGRGSAHIRSTNGVPIVGVSEHWATSLDMTGIPGGGSLPVGDHLYPGLSSMQQLQAAQVGKTKLYLGPLPRSTTSPINFLERNVPFFWVMNPNPTPTTATISMTSRLGVILPTVTVTIPPFATHLELTLWNLFLTGYLAGTAVDDDYRVAVSADQPILGDVVMADFFGNGAFGRRLRIGSAMMANTPSTKLVNADLTFVTPTLGMQPGIQTLVGLFNPTTADIGPVNVRYYNRDGVVLSSETYLSFPRGAVRRIGPGLPDSPNYPAAPVFAGWMRITACGAGLVGWTMRTEGDIEANESGFKEVWGEELTGANGLEPGNGFNVTGAGTPRVRKVAPLVRATGGGGYWPGYTTFVTDRAANAGSYEFRYFAADTNFSWANGTPIPPGGAFNGVRAGATSFTYEDPLVFTGPINLSERVDTANGGIDGINVIGDPLGEWGIFDALPTFEEP